MDILLMIIFVSLIITYTTIYITKGNGLWKNIEDYTPSWSEKILIYVFFYLYISLIFISWITNVKQFDHILMKRVYTLLVTINLILFSFIVFCLSESNTSIEESFIIGSILLGILLVTIMLSLGFNRTNAKIFSILPLAIYLYLYSWLYEIKNNY